MADERYIDNFNPITQGRHAASNLLQDLNPHGSHAYTEAEGRNTRVNPEEQRDVSDYFHAGSYDGYTRQRIPIALRDNAADVSEFMRNRAYPHVRIPFRWYKTFLPNRFTDRYVGGRDARSGGTKIDRRQKQGPHMVALENRNIRAPTRTTVEDRDGHRHHIVANARPLLLYKKVNTADRPSSQKHCAYGKIRDLSTNSWRCVKNPNHHDRNIDENA